MKPSELLRIAAKEHLLENFTQHSSVMSRFICIAIGHAAEKHLNDYHHTSSIKARDIIGCHLAPDNNLEFWLRGKGYILTVDEETLINSKLDIAIQKYRKNWMLDIARKLKRKGM